VTAAHAPRGTVRPHAAAPAPAWPAFGTRWAARAAPLAGEPLLSAEEAGQVAAVHDHLRHAGRPTAWVRPCPSPDPDAHAPRVRE
jgi:hypothetical protein